MQSAAGFELLAVAGAGKRESVVDQSLQRGFVVRVTFALANERLVRQQAECGEGRELSLRRADDFAGMSDLPAPDRTRLAATASLARLKVDAVLTARDGTRKLRLRTADGAALESVLIPNEERGYTQCVSSQVGCALDCDFCATAKLGFGRHLSVSEIISQVYLADRLLASLPEGDPTRRAGGERVTNLVFMGMGEPLHNYDNLVKALSILLHPLGRNFSRRRITVSTAGLVPAIERLAQEPLRVNLAVSLNATTDAQRDVLMPINRRYDLATLLAALRRFPLERRQRITFEYVLLHGVNDSLEDARRLPGLLRGIPCKLNVIPWNEHAGGPYKRPPDHHVLAFQAEAQRLGFTVYLRKTRGADIDAACGQLAAENDPRAGQARKLRSLPVLPGPGA